MACEEVVWGGGGGGGEGGGGLLVSSGENPLYKIHKIKDPILEAAYKPDLTHLPV